MRTGILFFYFEKKKRKKRNRGVMCFCSFVSDFYVFGVSVTVSRSGLSDAREVQTVQFMICLNLFGQTC